MEQRMTDDELIERSRKGDRISTNELMERYKAMVASKAASMYIQGADENDLIQEGMIGLFSALQDYDFGRDASFATFADLCVSRQLYTAVTASNRMKHWPLNHAVSIDGETDKNSETGLIVDLVNKTLQQTPEEQMIDQENVDRIIHFLRTGLSEFEKKVLDLHLMGMPYAKIAGVLNTTEKSVDNALQRIKSKLKKEL